MPLHHHHPGAGPPPPFGFGGGDGPMMPQQHHHHLHHHHGPPHHPENYMPAPPFAHVGAHAGAAMADFHTTPKKASADATRPPEKMHQNVLVNDNSISNLVSKMSPA
eukprot:SM000017S02897  [mRNA]  locus=s17:916606:916926:- [translate_table: standard]